MKLSHIALLLSGFVAEVSAHSLRLSSQSTSSCSCQTNSDCQNSVCNFNSHSNVGTCGAGGKFAPFREFSHFHFGGDDRRTTESFACTSCQSNFDCQNQVCNLEVGTCVIGQHSMTRTPLRYPTKAPVYIASKVPTRFPTKAPVYIASKVPTKVPTKTPTEYPTADPTEAATEYPTADPTKAATEYPIAAPTEAATEYPIAAPTEAATEGPIANPVKNDCCIDLHNVPTKCEVDTLIELLDIAISSDHKLAAQWLRLAHHDAGTFNIATDEGGANGCLMNDLSFLSEANNGFLDIPINSLEVIKNTWVAQPDSCLVTSAADIIQFAGLLASLRQVPPAGIDPTKRDTLMQFEWGRPDELNCDIQWTENLPTFRATPSDVTDDLPLRCLNAGGEIKTKMMERNGLTAEESAALMGAHTIGLSRNSFPVSNPWVQNGADSATPSGPVFDNGYHAFLANNIRAKDALAFSSDQTPFNTVFPDWFLDSDDDLTYLDTDIALAFPTQDPDIHPNFHTFTTAFADDNALFLETFFRSLDKLGKLGVHELLSPATECTPCDGNSTIGDVGTVVNLVSDLGSAKAIGEKQLGLRKESDEFTKLFDQSTIPLEKNHEHVSSTSFKKNDFSD